MQQYGSYPLAEADGPNDITNVDSTPLPAGEPRLSGVAETLRAAREAAGLDIKQLAALTRVTSRHLIALEAGDYAALPGRPYAIGFAKTYARAVGLDDKAITEAVRAELDQQAPAPAPRVLNQFEVGDPAKTPTRLTVWLAAGLVVAIVLAGLVFWRNYYLPSGDLPSLIGDEPPAAASSQVAVVPLPAPAPDGPVVFTAMEERIWVKFYDLQGQQILQKELAMGESFTIPSGAQEPMLRTARPDALSITVGGQPVPRIAETEGLVKDVPVSAAALLSRSTAPAPAASIAPVAPAPVARTQRPRQSAPSRSVEAPVEVPVVDAAPASFEETPPASTGL